MIWKQKWLVLAAAGCLALGSGQAWAASADMEAAAMAAPAEDEAAMTDPAEGEAAMTAPAESEAAGQAAMQESQAAVQEGQAAAQEDQAAAQEIPNPMVPYDSYASMVSALSFHPLYFPLSSGLELTERYIIGGTTAEICYTSRYGQEEKRARFVVRTTLLSDGMNAETLSGVYGADWKLQQLGHTQVQIAELGSDSFVAYWTQGGYAFSVGADQLNRWDFLRQLRDNLIDLSEHYYD
ncbi:hypothetical protein [Mitsuokella sp.]|uniref:hypothetical protein n=1 Tax=Mitsuokella sp. TaxID=2049034 RepID=UPI002A7F0F95|nr:hypothetical protein [Mitsuokella sp.]MDY4475570.1 hypothetical protein [Mitsuokella sp.]